MDLLRPDLDVLGEFHFWVVDQIYDPSETLPSWHCRKLGLRVGSSYADALWNLAKRLG